MSYAIVTEGVVTNIISLMDGNASDFPNAIRVVDRPVAIGDNYENGKFYRNGIEVLSKLEEANATAESLAERVVDLELQLLEV